MRYVLLLILSVLSANVFPQITYNPIVESQNMSKKKFQIEKVEITPTETIVTLYIVGGSYGEWMSISSNTTLMATDGYNDLTFPIRALTDHGTPRLFNQRYSMPGRKKESHLDMHFDRIPSGYTILTIRENISSEFVWRGIHITNPIGKTPHKDLSESEIKTMISNSDDGICGIYEGIDRQGYKLACIKNDDEYQLVFLNMKNNNGRWKMGDVKAELRSSASTGLFKATWYMADKSKNEDTYIVFDGTTMKTYVANEETNYLKMYPTASNQNGIAVSGNSWSGTGIALKDGYIATNYHIVENASNINIYGVDGNSTIKYSASVIATDKVNDLALIQIKDSQFKGFDEIPYKIKITTSDVGEEIFVLGYPLITTMGNEIKLTTGVISSKTGFMGDVALYQISAPIQPGNSGGPLFDNKGNLIGIVNAKHKGAENVGYAIKASYLNNLVESVASSSILPNNNNVSTLNLTNKVKNLEKFVFMIICSN